MATKKKLLQAAAGSAGGGAGLNIEEVFSTYLYDGTGSTQTITNGIDLAGEGGLVWAKSRSTRNHILSDTERGTGKVLFSNSTSAEDVDSTTITSYNSDGFTMGSSSFKMNTSGEDFASWTFRKAPKFFDVVTYTGNGVAGRTVSHNLGSVPAMIIVKRTNGDTQWPVFHTSLGQGHYLHLDANTSKSNYDSGNSNSRYWNNTAPTSTEFTVSSNSWVNSDEGTYVAYLFAHNDGDGGFGSTADQDIIKCGSYTGNGSASGPEINLGFEPQWLLIKKSTNTRSWILIDNMRNMSVSSDAYLYANLSNAEVNKTSSEVTPTATGFKLTSASEDVNGNDTYIYIAIRRGPMAVPTDATDVFAIDTSSSSDPNFTSGFPVDMTIKRDDVTASGDNRIYSRITNGLMYTNQTFSESSVSSPDWQFMNGYGSGGSASTNKYGWMWRRAPNFFDVVAYDGNNTAGHAVPHNLGVTPEMVWVKERNDSVKWYVFMPSILGTTSALTLNDTNATITVDSFTTYNETNLYFSGDGDVNGGGSPYIAYLFASLDGVSKVGSYTGNGTSQNIDCGFSSGARFVLIKAASTSGQWAVWDTQRGIVAGDDSTLYLDSTVAADIDLDFIDPYSSGFNITNLLGNYNASGVTYIFYAIA